MSSNAFCFIPAKYTSTRLKKKNILKVASKELLGYVIEAAKKSKVFKEIVVSTESKEVKKVALKFGAEVPYSRPEYLAKDPYGVKDVLVDFFERFPNYIEDYNYVYILLPTCPLISSGDIISIQKRISEHQEKSIFSITENDHSAFRSVTVKEGVIQPIFKDQITKKSQELEKSYRISGAIIALEIQSFIKHKTFFQSKVGFIVVPRDRSVDVDKIEDLEYVRFLLERKAEAKVKK